MPDSYILAELKLSKPAVRTSKQWSSESVKDLVCLVCTDWDVFKFATDSLDEFTEAVRTAVNPITMTNPGSQSNPDSQGWKRRKHLGVGKDTGGLCS